VACPSNGVHGCRATLARLLTALAMFAVPSSSTPLTDASLRSDLCRSGPRVLELGL
jgi:hypothetical protein